MSDFSKKRVAYINSWPNSKPFEAENNYKYRCEQFCEMYGSFPFSPMKLWDDNDDTFNRAISHLIDGLEMMPLKPNYAFTFMFSGLDFYAKSKYSGNTTVSLKHLADDLAISATANSDVKGLLTTLFSAIPVNACVYLYKCLCGMSNHNSNVNTRVTTDLNNTGLADHSCIVNAIANHYGYDVNNYNTSIRQAALLYRHIFSEDNVQIVGNPTAITDKFRIYLLLLGFIYSLRNDALHGSSMSSTKSSQTTPERYALNYYAFLSAYTIFTWVIIEKSSLSQTVKDLKFTELKQNTEVNIDRFKKLFGNHIR